MPKTQAVENAVIKDIHGALSLLSERRLETRESEDRVSTLLRKYFKKAKKEVSRLHREIIRANPAPEGWDDVDLPVRVLETRQLAFDDMLDGSQDIPTIPEHLYLTSADMPKLMKGEAGDENRRAVAAIMAKLHFLYRGNGENDAPVVDGKDGAPAED